MEDGGEGGSRRGGGLFELVVDEIFQPGPAFYVGMTLFVVSFVLCWLYLCALAAVTFTGPMSLGGEEPGGLGVGAEVVDDGAVSLSGDGLVRRGGGGGAHDV